MCLGSFQAYAHTVFLFSPFKTGSSFSVNVLWLFQQASIYLPSYFCSSCSSHGLCSVWRMALPQSLFFGFVPSCTCGPVPEGSFPQNKSLGANMDTTHTYHLPTGCKKNVQPKFKIFGVFLGVLSESSSFPSFSSFCGLGQPSPPYLNLSTCIGQHSTLYQHASFLLSSLLWLQVSSFWSSCTKFLQHSTIS